MLVQVFSDFWVESSSVKSVTVLLTFDKTPPAKTPSWRERWQMKKAGKKPAKPENKSAYAVQIVYWLGNQVQSIRCKSEPDENDMNKFAREIAARVNAANRDAKPRAKKKKR